MPEQPLPLASLRALFSPELHDRINYVTRRCRAFPGSKRGPRRRGSRYLPSEVRRRLKALDDKLPPDCFEYPVGKQTMIARENIWKSCGVAPGTVDKWVDAGDVDPPARRNVDGGPKKPLPDGTFAPLYRHFYVKEQIDARRAKLAAVHRTPTEIRKLDDNDHITIPEMESLDVTYSYLLKHTEVHTQEGRRKKRLATPAEPIGRFIDCKVGEDFVTHKLRDPARPHVVNTHRQKVKVLLPRWGDIRELIENRDNPPLLDGRKLVRDALLELPKFGIKTNEVQLKRLIDKGVIEGGKVDSYTKNFKACKMWWMRWTPEQREKLQQYLTRFEKPGKRMCWIGGEDYYPVIEAYRLAAFEAKNELIRVMPLDYHGFGEPAPGLGKPVRCAVGNIKHKNGDTLSVVAGNDLRTIAEARTGVRPKAPTKLASAVSNPRHAAAPAPKPPAPEGGNGHAATPTTVPTGPAESPRRLRVQLLEDDRVAVIDGRRRKQLTPAKFAVVKFLVGIAPAHSSLDELQRRTRADAPKYLRELSRDPDWAPVIHRPGSHDRKGLGYGIY